MRDCSELLGDPCHPTGPWAMITNGWFKLLSLGVVYYVAIASQGIGEEGLPLNGEKTTSLFNSGGARATQIRHRALGKA